MKLYLASTSPRRRNLLNTLGILFEVVTPRFEECPTELPPGEEADFFAEQKARSVADLCPNAWVIGCDTLISSEGEKLGKPSDDKEAFAILSKLSGKRHQVMTAIVLLNTSDSSLCRHLEVASVTFRPLTEKEIRDYIATGEPIGKAGAYAVQGKAGRQLIEKVEGDEEAVIGLPLKVIRGWLKKIMAS